MSDWIKAAKVGDKVVFIGPDTEFGHGNEITPKKNGVYTIREILVDYWPERGTHLRLVEIVNEPFKYARRFHEAAFNSKRFRPVQPRNTDITIFTNMLKPVEKPVEEVA